MDGSVAEVRRLREELSARFGSALLPGGAPSPDRFPGFRTGVGAIDQLLPGGVPRGALSLWTGEASAGRTAALRALVVRACAEGATVALVDAGRTLDAAFARTSTGAVEGLWVSRPPDSARTAEGVWAAEALLRTGVFDLVILDGHLPDAGQAHRLRALARERDAAVVVTPARSFPSGHRSADDRRPRAGERFSHSRAPVLGFRADVRLEFRRAEGTRAEGLLPGGRFRRRVRVRLGQSGGGTPMRGGEREVELVYEPTDRLYSHIPIPDRSPGRR